MCCDKFWLKCCEFRRNFDIVFLMSHTQICWRIFGLGILFLQSIPFFLFKRDSVTVKSRTNTNNFSWQIVYWWNKSNENGKFKRNTNKRQQKQHFPLRVCDSVQLKEYYDVSKLCSISNWDGAIKILYCH